MEVTVVATLSVSGVVDRARVLFLELTMQSWTRLCEFTEKLARLCVGKRNERRREQRIVLTRQSMIYVIRDKGGVYRTLIGVDEKVLSERATRRLSADMYISRKIEWPQRLANLLEIAERSN